MARYLRKFPTLVIGFLLVELLCAIDVPLTIREEQGVKRVQNPINSGVPLPKGAVIDPTELRLLDERGRVVLASIEPRCRWLGDQSLKWVTLHFLTDVPAHGSRQYRLVRSSAPIPESPLRVERVDEGITVVTGPAKFLIATNRSVPFEQVSVRANLSAAFDQQRGLLAKPATIILSGINGQSRVQDGKTEIVKIEAPFQHAARVGSAQIEEEGPARVVVALKGTFSTETVESLDFTSRLYFYASSGLVQMTFSLRNRQLDDMARFVGVEQLRVELALERSDDLIASVDIDGRVVEAQLESAPLKLLQLVRNKLTLSLPGGSNRTGMQSDGWVQLRTGDAVFAAGNRWFWQTYPKGVEVSPDGTSVLSLKPAEGERIDLYTGGAKTHFLYFHFSSDGMANIRSIAAANQFPLVAAPPPDWYCQETRVFGELYSARLENFAPQYHDLIERFQSNVDSRIRKIVESRSREDWPTPVDEYGWLDFGSGLHHFRRTDQTSAESWWDSNYYDFPHAALVNYLRTGELVDLRTAEEAGLHLADIDICHSFPGNPEYAGAPRSGPVIGHFRNYTRGRHYMGHGSFTFYKNESLYELYYLTGERWYHDVALMSSEFAMARWGKGALRNLAHGIWGVLSAYQDTHEKRYLERARFFVEEWGIPWQDKFDGGFDDQHWMYGLLFEAYAKYIAVTGDEKTARYLVKALDALIQEFWVDGRGTGFLPGINVYGFGLGFEITGKKEYFLKGLQLMELLAEPNAEGDRVKTFAQNFRSSPYFLVFLTKDYKPGSFLLTKRQ